MGSDGGNINGSVIGCVYGACKDTTIGGTSGGGGGQPTPTTASLIVTKEVDCPFGCPGIDASDFEITVAGNNPSPSTFQGDPKGTTVTLGPGKYTVTEAIPPFPREGEIFVPSFSGNCQPDSFGSLSASGSINAGETQKCTITNTQEVA